MIAQLEAMLRDAVKKYLYGGCMDYYELRHTNLQRPGFDDSVVL